LFIVPSLRTGGAEKVCCNICDNLDYSLFEVHLVSMSDEVPLAETLSNQSKITVYTCGQKIHGRYTLISVPAFIRLFRYIRRIKPHIVHSHLWGLSCLYLLGFLNCYPKPVFFATIHSAGFIYTSKRLSHRFFLFLENSIYRIFRFNLVSVSEAVHEMVRSRLYFKNIIKIYNGINTRIIRDIDGHKALKESLRAENSYPIIIHVGRATKEKRQEDIIKAVQELLGTYPLTKLLLIGREVKKTFTPLVKELNLEDNVLLSDERNDIANLLQISDIGVFPSLFEGLPLALIEMMAAGLPLVVSDIPVLRDITGSGNAAMYVPVKNPGSISRSLNRLLSDRDLMKQLGINGRKIVEERFSLTKMVKEYTNIYLNEYYG